MKIKQIISKVCNKETILYIIFGVITTAVDFAAFSLLYYVTGANEVVANTIAWVLAVIVAFVTNKLIVFENRSTEKKEIIREIVSFALARVLSLVITDGFLVLAKIIKMNMLFAKAIISVVVVILNYIFSKLFIFKNQEDEKE